MKYLQILILVVVLAACQSETNVDYKAALYTPEYFHKSWKKINDIVVYDILSPPVATRIYTYPTIAAYEIIAQSNPEYRSLAGQLTDFTPIPPIDTTTLTDPYLAALEVFSIIGQRLIFSEERMEAFRTEMDAEWERIGIPARVLKDSKAYAMQVAEHFGHWMATDQYKETRTMPKYAINDEPGRWQPTPPGYIDGIEPHWNKIRPMVMKSADQFAPPLPPVFDTIPGSAFYMVAKEVYDSTKTENDDYIEIASFWDCNPFVSHHRGHVLFGTKKISPGGHWLGITGIAARKADLNVIETINSYTLVSIGLWDSFISCWDAKYQSNLLRPETYINRYIDPYWRPLLQTPPFPEHTSGHSVLSATSAELLTAIFGDNFEYDDTIEIEYGLPMRSFSSFHQAADEASISRLYGGIHYRPAIELGKKQGRQIGQYILEHLETRTASIAHRQ